MPRMRKWVVRVVLVVALFLGSATLWIWRGATADAVYRRASAEYLSGQYDQAESDLKRLERLRRPSYFDRLLRGLVASARNQPDKAIAELDQIPDTYPLAPLARIAAGQTEIRRSRTRAAETAFLTALKLCPSAVQARRELVYIYNIQHRQLEMDAQLAALADLQTLSYQYVLHWSKTRNVVWSPKEDLPALESFVAADPDDRWSRLALAEGLRRLDRRDEAEKILFVMPATDPEARAARASLALDRGDFEAAEALVAQGPGDCPSLARLRGQMALLHRDADGAVRAYKKALASDPLDRSTLFGIGIALKMTGGEQAAERYLEASRRHDAIWSIIAYATTAEGEKDPKVPRSMGAACASAGRIAEARAWLKLAIKNDSTDAAAQEELYKIEHDPGTAARSVIEDTDNPSSRHSM